MLESIDPDDLIEEMAFLALEEERERTRLVDALKVAVVEILPRLFPQYFEKVEGSE